MASTKSKSGSKSSSSSKAEPKVSAANSPEVSTSAGSAAMTAGTPQMNPPTKAVDEGKAKPVVLDDLHTLGDDQATPGRFCRIVSSTGIKPKGNYDGEYGVLIEDAAGENVIVRLKDAPGVRLSVPYGNLTADSPYERSGTGATA